MTRSFFSSACLLTLLCVASGAVMAQPQPLAVMEQAANAAALGQGQMPGAATPPAGTPAVGTPAGATAPAAAADPAAASSAHPGVLPGVTPTTAPAPESKDNVHGPFKRSLFFTPSDLVQIQKALIGVQPLPEGQISAGEVIPQVRTIKLTGIIYKNPEEWLIWLNDQKINRHTFGVFREILDIQVERDRVHLKWFDIGLNGVINVTMRPHQKYDIVTGLMLPVPPEQ